MLLLLVLFWLVQGLKDLGWFYFLDILNLLLQTFDLVSAAISLSSTSRLLATLYKDERVRERPELKKDGVAAILEKMYLGTLVKREHVCLFSLCIPLSEHESSTV